MDEHYSLLSTAEMETVKELTQCKLNKLPTGK
jgi:hypothetical protein